MFWGLVLEPGKRYSTTVDKSFHVSMAALDCSSVKSDSEILSVILECDGQENILCNLSKQKVLQTHLDLNFMTGDTVAFEIKGSGVVHLSGYLVPEDVEDLMNMQEYDDVDEEEDEEEEEEEELTKTFKKKGEQQNAQLGKRKEPPQINENKKKKTKLTDEMPKASAEDSDEDDDDDDDEDDDEDEQNRSLTVGDLDLDSGEDDDDEDDDEDEDSDEEEDESDEEEVPAQQSGKKQIKTPQSANKKAQQTPTNKQTPNTKHQQSGNKQSQSGTPVVNGSGLNQSGKKNKKKEGEGQNTPNQKTPGSAAGTPQQKKKTLEGGVTIKDIREGNGPIAKSGQMVSVYYQGRLKSNNKIFDECKRGGPAFKFRLGKGEVIKGWDIGVAGMKVGGSRVITCPPSVAYGPKGSPPQIPPNSSLVFQVELKGVN